MAGNETLLKAMSMFADGVKDLQFSRSLAQANEQVAAIKASESNEQEQRAQLQQVAQSLTMRMAQFGTPATTMEQISGAIRGPKLDDSKSMASQAIQTGNEPLLAQAQKMQAFEQNPQYKIAQLQARALANMGTAQAGADKKQAMVDESKLTKYSESIDVSKSSSRTPMGQMASVLARGDRLKSILGDPSKWSAMTPDELELVKEGVVQMSKGGVMTQEEHKTLSPFMLKLQSAKAETAITGKPATVDFSGYADLYNKIIDREGEAAKSSITKDVLSRASGNYSLAKRKPEEFKIATARALRKYAGDVSPEDIEIDSRGVSLKQKSAAAAPAPAAQGEIVRQTKDGRKAVFDSNKNFLRYL